MKYLLEASWNYGCHGKPTIRFCLKSDYSSVCYELCDTETS